MRPERHVPTRPAELEASFAMLSDEELYRRLVGGEMSAFDELYVRYEARLFGFILGQLGDRAEAEDVFHDAFMTVLRERRHGELTSFKAWIFQVARHLCLNRVRSQKRAIRALEREGRHADESPVHPENVVTASAAPDELRRALAKLPQSMAHLYELRASGLSYHEIAAVLGVPLGTVKSRISEMIRRLKEEIQPWIAR